MTPEEKHLADQQATLDELADALTAREQAFAEAGTRFARFREMYVRRFAPLYADLDGLEAQVARLLAADSPELERAASEAAEKARRSEGLALELVPEPQTLDGLPSTPALRESFKQAARLVHPDLASTDVERERRTVVMARVNEAYASGDQRALEDIIAAENSRPEAITGDDVGAGLVRVLRQIAQVRRRLDELTALEAGLRNDPLWRLYEVVVAGREEGSDRLAELEADLRNRIASAQGRLAAITLATKRFQIDAW